MPVPCLVHDWLGGLTRSFTSGVVAVFPAEVPPYYTEVPMQTRQAAQRKYTYKDMLEAFENGQKRQRESWRRWYEALPQDVRDAIDAANAQMRSSAA